MDIETIRQSLQDKQGEEITANVNNSNGLDTKSMSKEITRLEAQAEGLYGALKEIDYEIGMMYLPGTDGNREYKTRAKKIIDEAITQYEAERTQQD